VKGGGEKVGAKRGTYQSDDLWKGGILSHNKKRRDHPGKPEIITRQYTPKKTRKESPTKKTLYCSVRNLKKEKVNGNEGEKEKSHFLRKRRMCHKEKERDFCTNRGEKGRKRGDGKGDCLTLEGKGSGDESEKRKKIDFQNARLMT